jgi:PAS domain S-box-containing protein
VIRDLVDGMSESESELEHRRAVLLARTRYGALLEAAPDAMVIVDRAGRIAAVNEQTGKMFGWGREELVGKPVEMLVPNRFHVKHAGHRDGYSKDPKVRPMGAAHDLYGQRKDGTEIPVEISLSPLQMEEGSLVCAAIRDVTERRRLEEIRTKSLELLEEQYRRIQEASRMKSEFLANMSHELRTPLNAVIGFAELLHDGKAGAVSADQKEYLGDILTSAQHLLQLINDVLDLAKVEAGKMTFRMEPIDPARLAAEVRDTLRSLVGEKRMSIQLEVAPDFGDVVADAAKLRQILYNYLSNALKFTPDGGRVVVSITAEGRDHFRIAVADTGIGIRAEDLGRLFVEFQQLDGSAAKEYAGTGLGLALTKRIVEAQGGRVGVTSQPGKGSTFFAVLPRVAPGLDVAGRGS